MKTKFFTIITIFITVSLLLTAGVVLYLKTKPHNQNDFSVDDLDVQENDWIITQHGRNDVNLSFYTIYNDSKGLIVIDGGWTDDAAYVREILNELGGNVDAWILTHPHQDHVGAFNLLYTELEGITVKTIYTVDMATPEECLNVASWDSVDAYNDFLSLNVPNLQYLYAGDELDICGLKFKVLNTYDDNVKNLSRDYLNDGSMMFKVTNQTESILFCADVGISMSDFLLNKWGNELQADYLQMAHHGFGGLNDNLYQTVNPKIAFFDAPDWLMFDETGKYDTPQNAEFMNSIGSEIYSFNTAPNSIVLK